MHTKCISAKLDRVSSRLLVIFALDAAEKKQTQTSNQVVDCRQCASQGDGGDPEQRRIRRREL